MSRIEDWMEMEEAVSPERLEQMAASECPPLTNDEQQRIKQNVLQKIVQLQDAQTTEQYALAAEKEQEQAVWLIEHPRKKRFRLGKHRWIAAALVCAFVLSLSTAVAATLSTDERLLKLLHADSQSQIAQLSEMSTYIGSTATADGYTLTVQEAVSDKHHVWLLLDLVGPEDVVLDADQICYRDVALTFAKLGGNGYSFGTLPDEIPDDNRVSFLLDLSSRKSLVNNKLTLKLGDLGLLRYNEKGEAQWTILSEGNSQFEFTLPDNDTTVSMWQWKVLQHQGKNFLLTKMELSPLSITLKTRRLEWDMYAYLRKEPVQIYLKNGEMVELDSNSSGSGGLVMDFSYTMPEPLDLTQIDRIVYCGEELHW